MRTIRGKMLFSLCIAMLVTVAITVMLFVRLIDDILVNQVKAELHGQVGKAQKLLSDGDMTNLNSTKFKYVVKGLMMNADYMILDGDQKIIDASNEKEEGKQLHYTPTGKNGIALLHGRKVLYAQDKLRGLSDEIFIYSPLSSLRALYGSLMRTTLLSIGASFVVILAIGLFAVSRVVRPLNRLKEAVGRYEPSYA